MGSLFLWNCLIYLDNKEERQFYEQHTIQNAWSVRELRRQIRSHLYERAKGRGEITIIQPIAKALQPEQVFKDKWQEGQRQPIGLIVCRTKDEETVHYALGDLKKEIFVAEYGVKLPSEEEIKRRIMGLEE